MFTSILPSFEGFDLAAKFGAKSQGGEEMASKGFHMEDYVQVGNEPLMFQKSPEGLQNFNNWHSKLLKDNGNIIMGDQVVPVNSPMGQEAMLKAELQIKYGFDADVAGKAAHDLIFGAKAKAGSKSMADDASAAGAKSKSQDQGQTNDGGQGRVQSNTDARIGSNAAAKGKSAQDSNSHDGNNGNRGLGDRGRSFYGNQGQRFQPRSR